MPRTLDVESYAGRRDAFLDVAQRLIQTRGYDAMSIQEVLDQMDTSRGSLYHYFDSKQALLDGVVDRLTDSAMAAVEPLLEDPSLPALRKLERVFGAIAQYKAERKELIVAIIDVWASDGNALVRDKVRRLTASKLGPIMSAIIQQGVAEGAIKCGAPDDTARVLLCLMQGYQDLAGEQFLARQAGRISFADVLRTHAAFTEAFERILGVNPGSVTLASESTLKFWLG